MLAPLTYDGNLEDVTPWIAFAESMLLTLRRFGNNSLMQSHCSPDFGVVIMVQINPDRIYIRSEGYRIYITARADLPSPASSRKVFNKGIFQAPIIKENFYAGGPAIEDFSNKKDYWYSGSTALSWSSSEFFIGGRWSNIGGVRAAARFGGNGRIVMVFASGETYYTDFIPNPDDETGMMLSGGSYYGSIGLADGEGVLAGGFLTDGKTLFVLTEQAGVYRVYRIKFVLGPDAEGIIAPIVDQKELLMTGQYSEGKAWIAYYNANDPLGCQSFFPNSGIEEVVLRTAITDMRVIGDTAFIFTTTPKSISSASGITAGYAISFYTLDPNWNSELNEYGFPRTLGRYSSTLWTGEMLTTETQNHACAGTYEVYSVTVNGEPSLLTSSSYDYSMSTKESLTTGYLADQWSGITGDPPPNSISVIEEKINVDIVFYAKEPLFAGFDGNLILYQVKNYTQKDQYFQGSYSLALELFLFGQTYQLGALSSIDSNSYGFNDSPWHSGLQFTGIQNLTGDRVATGGPWGKYTAYYSSPYTWVDVGVNIAPDLPCTMSYLGDFIPGPNFGIPQDKIDFSVVELKDEVIICFTVNVEDESIDGTTKIKRVQQDNGEYFLSSIETTPGRLDSVGGATPHGTVSLSVTQDKFA